MAQQPARVRAAALGELLVRVDQPSVSLASSGVASVCVYASIARPSRHSTGSLRATPRGSTATMS